MFEVLINNANDSMTTKEIENLFIKNADTCETDFDSLIERVKNGENKEEILSQIKEECKISSVAEYIINRLNQALLPYEETQFLRDLEYEVFIEKIPYIFDNLFFRIETKDKIIKKTDFDEEQIESAKKLINTVVQYYMINRYTHNYFSIILRDSFSFNKARIDFLWDYCEENKEKMEKIIIMRCYSMLLGTERSISNIFQIFSSVLDDDEEDE